MTIGVIAPKSHRALVNEFFQLFKVPWEFYREGKDYDVVIISGDVGDLPTAKVTLIFGTHRTDFDSKNGVAVEYRGHSSLLRAEGHVFPVYTGVAVVQRSFAGKVISFDTATLESAGIEMLQPGQRRLRIGYDLFEEIRFNLSEGQPIEFSEIPTVEIHIALLRHWIVTSGIPLVEIPPVPFGHSFVACLTHDVDFVCIRDHRFDRALFGFIIRALFPFLSRSSRSGALRRTWRKNLRALAALPAVFSGRAPDTWFDMDRYVAIEQGKPSTFFFIPKPRTPGSAPGARIPRFRAAQYDLRDCGTLIVLLRDAGHEVALHGIDAWQSSESGRVEKEAIRQLTGDNHIGVRMHWLYFSKSAPVKLAEAGFCYDSTLGYNERVGFRSGTTQVFHMPDRYALPELPMNIMDTALFYPGRMGLSHGDALWHCRTLISHLGKWGGVLTVNWHTRSLSPERNWDDFYMDLLALLSEEGPWFATARDAVEWFETRRSIRFEDIEVLEDKIMVKLTSDRFNAGSPILLRFYHLPARGAPGQTEAAASPPCTDIPWAGQGEVEFRTPAGTTGPQSSA